MKSNVMFGIVAMVLLLSACGVTNNSSNQIASVLPSPETSEVDQNSTVNDQSNNTSNESTGLSLTLNHERQLSTRNTHAYGVRFNGQSHHSAISSISSHNVIILNVLNDFDRSVKNGNRTYYAGFRSNIIELANNTIATTIKTENQLSVVKLNLDSQELMYLQDFDNSENDKAHSHRHHQSQVVLSEVTIDNDSVLSTSFETLDIESFNRENSTSEIHHYLNTPIPDGYGNTIMINKEGQLRKLSKSIDKWSIDLKEKVKSFKGDDIQDAIFPFSPVIVQENSASTANIVIVGMTQDSGELIIITMAAQFLCELSNGCLPDFIELTDVNVMSGFNFDLNNPTEYLPHVFVEFHDGLTHLGAVGYQYSSDGYTINPWVIRAEINNNGTVNVIHNQQQLRSNEEVIAIHETKWITLHRVRNENKKNANCNDINDEITIYNWDFSSKLSGFSKENITYSVRIDGEEKFDNSIILGAVLDNDEQLIVVRADRKGCYIPEDNVFLYNTFFKSMYDTQNPRIASIKFVKDAQLVVSTHPLHNLTNSSQIYQSESEDIKSLFVFNNEADSSVVYPISHGLGLLNNLGHLDITNVRPIISENKIILTVSPGIIILQ